MKKRFLTISFQLLSIGLFLLSSINLQGQSDSETKLAAKSTANVTRDVVYGSNLNWKGEKENLKL